MSTRSFRFWVPSIEIAERVLIIAFTLQKLIISTLYTYTTLHFLYDGYRPRLHNGEILLILAQVVIFMSDVLIVTRITWTCLH